MKIGKLGVLLSLLTLPSGIYAIETGIKASLSSNQISLNDSITLSLDIAGVNNVNPPGSISIPNFHVQRAGQTKSFQWVNGQSTALVSLKYILTPTQVGELTIPAITLTSGNKTYSTEPMTVQVSQSATTPAAGGSSQGGGANQKNNVNIPSEGIKPVFMTAKVDRSKATVGQQIILTVQFLRAPNVRMASQPKYTEPDVTGFLIEPLKQKEFATTLNGVRYSVNELRYALFPTSDGDFAIGSASIQFAVRSQSDPFDPNSFFESFFKRSRVVSLKTRAIPIQVRALPKNKPADFSGGVGRYKIHARVDNPSPEVGKPFNLILKIEGVGNIKSLKEPTFPQLSSFRTYETIPKTQVNNDGAFLTGSKEFKTLLIPQVSGQLSIPSIPYVYYNPDHHEFQTLRTQRIDLEVKPGILNPDDQDASYAATPGQLAEGIQVVEKDIRFLKSGSIRRLNPYSSRQGTILLVNSLPPIFALGAALALYRSKKKTLFAADYKSKKALGEAQKRLKKINKNIQLMDSSQFFGALSSTLMRFLDDKLSISTTGMTSISLDQLLQEKNISSELRTQIKMISDEADLARFATSSFSENDRGASLQKAQQLIQNLSRDLK